MGGCRRVRRPADLVIPAGRIVATMARPGIGPKAGAGSPDARRVTPVFSARAIRNARVHKLHGPGPAQASSTRATPHRVADRRFSYSGTLEPNVRHARFRCTLATHADSGSKRCEKQGSDRCDHGTSANESCTASPLVATWIGATTHLECVITGQEAHGGIAQMQWGVVVGFCAKQTSYWPQGGPSPQWHVPDDE